MYVWNAHYIKNIKSDYILKAQPTDTVTNKAMYERVKHQFIWNDIIWNQVIFKKPGPQKTQKTHPDFSVKQIEANFWILHTLIFRDICTTVFWSVVFRKYLEELQMHRTCVMFYLIKVEGVMPESYWISFCFFNRCHFWLMNFFPCEFNLVNLSICFFHHFFYFKHSELCC